MGTKYSKASQVGVPEAVQCQTISVEEAGRILGVARNTAYEAARAGQIPTLRIGRKLRVPKRALQRLLDGNP